YGITVGRSTSDLIQCCRGARSNCQRGRQRDTNISYLVSADFHDVDIHEHFGLWKIKTRDQTLSKHDLIWSASDHNGILALHCKHLHIRRQHMAQSRTEIVQVSL